MNKYSIRLIYENIELNAPKLFIARNKNIALQDMTKCFEDLCALMRLNNDIDQMLGLYDYSLKDFDFYNFEGVVVELVEEIKE